MKKKVCKFCGKNTDAKGRPFRSHFAFLGHQGRCEKNPLRSLPPKEFGPADGLIHAVRILEARGNELLQMAKALRASMGESEEGEKR